MDMRLGVDGFDGPRVRRFVPLLERLIAELLAERARFIGSLVGLTDAQFNSETAPGEWTYRVVAKHVLALEQDSLKTLAADRAARAGSAGGA
jgi:hypothetical protein